MPLTILRASLAAACVLAAAPAAAQPAATPAPPVDIGRLGSQVGERAPDFALRDHTGTPRTLASVLGPSGGLLVFFRSADW